MRSASLLAGITCTLVAHGAFAADDIAAGRQKAQACIACHGEGGRSTNPQFPKLAGQVEDYLAQAIKSYKTGGRKNVIMQSMVATLSEQDINDLAAYFSQESGDLFVKY
jgi:cytochrome c553